ncbi:MAG: hypothetical protein J6Y37_04500 [Paludibacteraceae bacterium]|nr:hypothetical protein [Paludibacteraceae bacterium]
MSKKRTIILIMAIIPFFSSCSQVYNGLKNILGAVAHEMEEETKETPFEPLEGYKIIKIERVSLQYGRDDVFPYIQMEDKEVERKVNTMLQMRNFGVVFNGSDGSCVDGIDHIVRWSYEEEMPSIRFYDNSFSRNLRIRIEYGTTRSGYRYYNFNPKTGELYHLEDFFSEENYRLFQSKLLGYEVSKDHLADFSYFEFNQTEIGVLISLSSRFDQYKYLKINISDIEPLLNDYGRAALITGEELDKYHTNLPPLLYEGMIGEEPVYYLRKHPFGGEDEIFFRNTGKFGERDGDVNFLEVPEERRTVIYDYERDRPDILHYCDSYWYDCRFRIKHIEREKDAAGLEPGDQNYFPHYVYKDKGKDLFCYHVTEDGLEGYYQTPYPLGHELKVTGFDLDKDEEEMYEYRIEKYGITPQKYQVKLKKM